MQRRASALLVVGICLLLPTLVTPMAGDDLVAGSPPSGVVTTGVGDSLAASPGASDWSCLPRYHEPEFLLTVNETHPTPYEPNPAAADFDGDGLDDVVITKVNFQTYETFELDILLNDGQGALWLATSSVYSGTVPTVQNPAQVLLEDFNGDDRADIFVADHGYDDWPYPGYQNTLVLTAPGGKLVDATANLPQQSDFTHSACAADVDGDDDIDLYLGEYWGQNDIDPQILLNDGSGTFSVGVSRLPPLVDLNMNGYTTCAFSDLDNDTSADLILGDSGDQITSQHSTPNSEVLLNDGHGFFSLLPDAMPPKDVSSHDIAHDIKPIHLNGDAYIDLLIVYEGWEGEGVGWQGSYIQALVNNGDGTFRNESASRLDPLDRTIWIRPLILLDLDLDGDLDLLPKHWDWMDADPPLFLNDGSGHFRLEPFEFGLPYLYYTFLDLRGNGRNDLLFLSSAPPEKAYALRDGGCAVYLPLIITGGPPGNR